MDAARKLRIWQKFASIAVLGAAIAALPLYGYVSGLRAELRSAREEYAGIEPQRLLLRLLRAVQAHRLHASRWVSGQAPARADCDADAEAVGEALAAVSRAPYAPAAGGDVTQAFQSQFAILHADVGARAIDAGQSLLRHERLVHAVQSWIDATGRSAARAQDPGPAIGPLLQAARVSLPRALEALSLAQASAELPSGAGAAAADRRLALSALLDRIRTSTQDADRELDSAMQAEPRLRLSIGVHAKLAGEAARQAAERVERLILAGAALARPPAPSSHDAALAAAVDAQAELADLALSAAGTLIASRRTDRMRALLSVALVAGLGGALAAWLLWSTARDTVASLAQASNAARRFGGAHGLADIQSATVADVLEAIRHSSAAAAVSGNADTPSVEAYPRDAHGT